MSTWPAWLAWSVALIGLMLFAVGLRRSVVSLARRGSGSALVSLVVVVKDREDVIEGVVRALIARYGWWPGHGPGYEIVIVDDGSIDDTGLILERLARGNVGFLRVVRRPVQTEGSAVPAEGASSAAEGPPAADTLAGSGLEVGLAACRGRTVRVLELESLLRGQRICWGRGELTQEPGPRVSGGNV